MILDEHFTDVLFRFRLRLLRHSRSHHVALRVVERAVRRHRLLFLGSTPVGNRRRILPFGVFETNDLFKGGDFFRGFTK
jgi:hypothetical protein